MVKPDRELYEPPYDDALMYDAVEEPQGPRGRPLVVLLGIVVLAAFAGVVWVAYNQGVKEGQRGNPPVLAADTGPTRIAPEGQASQPEPLADKTYERLTGETETAATEEQLLPQPEEPRPLPASPQDITAAPAPLAAAPLPAPVMSAPPAEAQDEGSDHPGLDTTLSTVRPQLPAGASQGLSSQTTYTPSAPSAASEDLTTSLPPAEDSMPTALVPAPVTPKPAAAAPKPAAPAPKPVVPKLPSELSTTTTVPMGEGGPLTPEPGETKTAALEPQAGPPRATPPSTGGFTIQLGAFPTDVLAAASWGKIKAANAEVLSAYTPKFQRAEVPGKGTWYRLQVTGFSDKTAAQDVCDRLKANAQACIILGR